MITRREAILVLASAVAIKEAKPAAVEAQQMAPQPVPPSLIILDGRPIVAIVKYKGGTKTISADEVWAALGKE